VGATLGHRPHNFFGRGGDRSHEVGAYILATLMHGQNVLSETRNVTLLKFAAIRAQFAAGGEGAIFAAFFSRRLLSASCIKWQKKRWCPCSGIRDHIGVTSPSTFNANCERFR